MATTSTTINLNYVESLATDYMTGIEQGLATTLAASAKGDSASVTDMVKMQIGMQKYTTSAAIISAVVKEVADGIKGVANKIG
jgi:hypothetical protein